MGPALHLWNSHLVTVEENRQFVDSKLFEDICGKEIRNRTRRMETLIGEMVAGLDIQPNDLIRKIRSRDGKTRIMIAAKIAQLLCLHGFKEMPWNETRRSIVEQFFPHHLLPDIDPFAPIAKDTVVPSSSNEQAEITSTSPAAETTAPGPRKPFGDSILPFILPKKSTRNSRGDTAQRYLRSWTSAGGSVKFWRQVFWFARSRKIPLEGLIQYAKDASVARRSNRYVLTANINLIKVLLKGLFGNRGDIREFSNELSIAMKTGNLENLITIIRKKLHVSGTPNVVPSIRVIKQSTATLMRNFIATCKPERTFSGFRLDLVSSVKLAAFLTLQDTDLAGVAIDIWGDGLEIGGVENTRLTFRLLQCDSISAQSTDAVFCFAAYRGKDSRFTLEQNIGPTVVGKQETGWLYQQTLELSRLGAKVSYSGDSPFLLRLILGISNDTKKTTPSRLPLYVDDNETSILPTAVDTATKQRTDLEIPFRSYVPNTALVHAEDIRCICPDAMHMLTRCVETDLKKMAQKICDDKAPNHNLTLSRLENNLTAREVKKPVFQFTRITTNDADKDASAKISAVSLSGQGALTAIADACELHEACPGVTDLYNGVWSEEIVSGTGENYSNSVHVLKTMFPALFIRRSSVNPNNSSYISTFDASELLRKSLNKCVVLLRESSEGLNEPEFKKWSEAYYQVSLLLFGEEGLTPYKLKLTLFSPIIAGGYIKSPWYHICEGLEKSNHHANRDFQNRTMRGGGLKCHQDPMFLEGFFSYCKFMKNAPTKFKISLSVIQTQAFERVHGKPVEESSPPSYLEICQVPLIPPTINVGYSTKFPFSGMRFHVLGSFMGTYAALAGKQQTPKEITPQQMVIKWVRQLGGHTYDINSTKNLLHKASSTPNCFIILKDGVELMNGTMTANELADAFPKKTSKKTKKTSIKKPATTGSDCDSDSSTSSTASGRLAKLSRTAKHCRELAVGDMTFIGVNYIIDQLNSETILDPYSSKYKLTPGSNVKKITVKDSRPLYLKQIAPQDANVSSISAIVSLKRYRSRAADNIQDS